VKLKQALGLVVGLVVGVSGGVLFTKSQRPEPGTMEDRLELAEERASRSDRQVRALQKFAEGSERGGFRRLAQDLKDGKDVTDC
jgi:hypothetical protein